MYCSHCGEHLAGKNPRFCPSCGNRNQFTGALKIQISEPIPVTQVPAPRPWRKDAGENGVWGAAMAIVFNL